MTGRLNSISPTSEFEGHSFSGSGKMLK